MAKTSKGIKKTSFKGWRNCVELQSGEFKIIATCDVGPRVIAAFVAGGENIFHVEPGSAGKTCLKGWNSYGGHRLWHSPEAFPRTYSNDNGKVECETLKGGGVLLSPCIDEAGIQKSLALIPLGCERFRVEHRLKNAGQWPVEIAAWALSVMAPGGTAVVPIPQGDKKGLLPNRFISIWPYTDMTDERLSFGKKFVLLKQDPEAKGPCKFGINCEDGWAAYVSSRGDGLLKSFAISENRSYPDNGCSVECYTNKDMLELETLSPLRMLSPGEELLHVEEWTGLSGLDPVKDEKGAAASFR